MNNSIYEGEEDLPAYEPKVESQLDIVLQGMEAKTLNIIQSCLRIDPSERLTAEALLSSGYFEIQFIERFAVVMNALKETDADDELELN